VEQPGFRTRSVVVVTTLLDPFQASKEDLASLYRARWNNESAFSRHKRLLGSALGGRSDASRERECHLRVLTHNLMLLAAAG
jgi:Transposase DDE domain